MRPEDTAPAFNASKFVCPHCGAFSQMIWRRLHQETTDEDFHGFEPTWIYLSTCVACSDDSIWMEDTGHYQGMKIDTGIARMVHPSALTAPLAHPDLPTNCRYDYDEARSISRVSPRGAAALLRLCIQKLCAELGQPGQNINDDIGALVKAGLPNRVQQALDAVRVIGNEAVHPGTLTPDDHADHVNSLFDLVNIIVEQMITQPAKVNELYSRIPAGKQDAIQQRDRKARLP